LPETHCLTAANTFADMTLSNDHWVPLVKAKVEEVLADTSFVPPTSEFSSITAPDAKFALGIDHTLLKPDATSAQIDELCDQAIRYKFKVWQPLHSDS
jgi:hypothetical protein